MGRLCSVCTHRERGAIDEALAARDRSFRDVAGHYRLAKSSLMRHYAEHLPVALIRAKDASEVLAADTLLKRLAGNDAHLERLTLAAVRALEGPDGEMRLSGDTVAAASTLIRAIGAASQLRQLYGRCVGLVRDRLDIHLDADPVAGLLVQALHVHLGKALEDRPPEFVEAIEDAVSRSLDSVETVLREKAARN